MNAADPGAGKKAINGARIIVTKIGTGPAGIESCKHDRSATYGMSAQSPLKLLNLSSQSLLGGNNIFLISKYL